MRMIWIGAAAGALALGGCATDGAATGTAAKPGASGTIRLASGADAGTVTATDDDGGMVVTVSATGLTPGVHGVHIHTTGLCDAPGFTTAGGHWNPTGKMHGSMNPMGPHEGDLPNLTAGADGFGTLTYRIAGASVAAMLDADGAAFVIHASADDYKTDPSGNSGGRIACAVFAPA